MAQMHMPNAPRSSMHPCFQLFPERTVHGAQVQIDLGFLDQAALSACGRHLTGDTNTLRIIDLAPDGDALDFHLSFKAEAGYAHQAHFCARCDALGQNACLYWFYALCLGSTPQGQAPRPNALPGSSDLVWSWEGCAGQGDAKQLWGKGAKGISYGMSAVGVLSGLLKYFNSNGRITNVRGRFTLCR